MKESHTGKRKDIIMKQTLEEAEKEYCEKNYPYSDLNIKLMVENAFEAGAEWQAKQMAWINVNNKMPEDGIEVDERTILAHTKNVIVLYKNGYVGKGKRIYIDNKKGWQWSCLKGEDIIYWMYYPN